MSQESVKTLEEKRQTLSYLICGNFLHDTSPKVRELKAKMNYMDLIKIKTFCTPKKTINTKKATDEMGVFANDLSDKGYYPKTYKELTKLHI